MKNCNFCGFLNITEEEQTNKKEPHICLKHDVRVYHHSQDWDNPHPWIYPCEQCDSKDFISRKV